MFVAFKRNLKTDTKVAQLAGSVADLASYHHGEVSRSLTYVAHSREDAGASYYLDTWLWTVTNIFNI